MSVRNDFSQVSAVSPTASALTLHTRISTLPSSAAAPSTHCFNAAGSATSVGLPQALTPLPFNAVTALSICSGCRAQIATLAPSAANRSAIARPIPLLPPVTRAFLPFSPRSMVHSSVEMPHYPLARSMSSYRASIRGLRDQRAVAMRHPHRDQILPAHDVGRIGRVEIGGVHHGCRRTFDIGRDGLAARKFEGVGPEHAAQPRISFCGIEHVREREIKIVLAGANPEMMPVIGIGAGRDRIVLRHQRSRMRGAETFLDRGRAGDEVAAPERQDTAGFGKRGIMTDQKSDAPDRRV